MGHPVWPCKTGSYTVLINTQVRCGGQFNAVLCDNGTVYTWGKGDHHRLGHGSEEHSPHPRVVEALLGKKVTDLAVGICHSAVCTGWQFNRL